MSKSYRSDVIGTIKILVLDLCDNPGCRCKPEHRCDEVTRNSVLREITEFRGARFTHNSVFLKSPGTPGYLIHKIVRVTGVTLTPVCSGVP